VLVAELGSFFGSNKVWSAHSLGVRSHAVATQLAERMSVLNTFAYSLERAVRVVPKSVAEARNLVQGGEALVNEFEGRGTLGMLRGVALEDEDAQNRDKFLDAYNLFRGRYIDSGKEANADIGDHVFGDPWG